MSKPKESVDEAILAELKALREEVKLLREQARVNVVVMPGHSQTIYVQQPAVYTPVPLPWGYPNYGGGGTVCDSGRFVYALERGTNC